MCKYEHYGNCDPETKDQEYCIFHKPNKNEDEAREFYRKFLERFKPGREKIMVKDDFGEKEIERLVFEDDVNCRGYVFPEVPDDIDFSFGYATFEGKVAFEEVTFEGNANFEYAVFERDVKFREVTFEGIVGFINTKFVNFTLFDKTKFNEVSFFIARFNEVSFNEVVFNEKVLFDRANFNMASFSKVEFNMTSFDEVVFNEVSFNEVVFNEDVSFRRVEFNEVSFRASEFNGEVSFDEVIFKKIAPFFEVFRSLTTNYEKKGREDDADKIFATERRILRRHKVLRARKVLRTIRDLRTNRHLNWTTLRESLKKEDLNPNWIKKYRYKKRTIGKADYLMLLARATWDAFTAYTGSAIEYALADFTCRYGTDWKKPVILWIALVIFVFPFIYCLTHSVFGIHYIRIRSIWDYILNYLNYVYFSVVTATTLGYGDLHPVGWGKAIASAEAIFGMFMWAVFLAVFSRKYMR